MPIVIGVKFNNRGKTYFFDPLAETFKEGDGVVVETSRGSEYAIVRTPNKDVKDKDIVAPLKPITRKATAEDTAVYERNLRDRVEVMRVTSEKVSKRGLDMKLADAEYSFDRTKLIIYFTAPSRIDFRELVKDLAASFKARIELRQIYERDEAKMHGALAPCGRPCCCKTHLSDFAKVSIKMAKIQGLSLNPQKISGVCGRLMCCLAYENDYYKEMFKKMPKLGSTATTPDGKGTVESNDMLRGCCKVKIQLNDGTYDIRRYKLSELKLTARQSEREIEIAGDLAELKKLED